jgi:repressor LexA
VTLTRRQRKILDFIRDFSERRGYAPTLAEIGRHFKLKSPATVHKHLSNLEERGALRRRASHSRAIELLPEEGTSRSFDLPLVGRMEAGRPLVLHEPEASVPVPPGLVGASRTYVLAVRGEGFADHLIGDGDFVVIEDAAEPVDGGLMLAVVRGNEPVLRRVLPRPPAPRPSAGRAAAVLAGDARLRGRVVGVLRKY